MQILQSIPVVNILFRVLDFMYGLALLGLGTVMVFRAGSTGLAEGVWYIPAIPEFLIVLAGVLVLNGSIWSLYRSVVPRFLMR